MKRLVLFSGFGKQIKRSFFVRSAILSRSLIQESPISDGK